MERPGHYYTGIWVGLIGVEDCSDTDLVVSIDTSRDCLRIIVVLWIATSIILLFTGREILDVTAMQQKSQKN